MALLASFLAEIESSNLRTVFQEVQQGANAYGTASISGQGEKQLLARPQSCASGLEITCVFCTQREMERELDPFRPFLGFDTGRGSIPDTCVQKSQRSGLAILSDLRTKLLRF